MKSNSLNLFLYDGSDNVNRKGSKFDESSSPVYNSRLSTDAWKNQNGKPNFFAKFLKLPIRVRNFYSPLEYFKSYDLNAVAYEFCISSLKTTIPVNQQLNYQRCAIRCHQHLLAFPLPSYEHPPFLIHRYLNCDFLITYEKLEAVS